MNKDFIKRMKQKHKVAVVRKSDGAKTIQVIYNGILFQDHCFARLFRTVRENDHRFKSFTFIVGFDKSSKYFDYNSLHKELNKLFGHQFKIVRYYSGRKNVRMLNFEQKGKFGHWKFWWFSVYLASCMLRLTDTVFINSWASHFNNKKRKKPINNWKELIYLFHRYIYSTSKGYELNERLSGKALICRANGGERNTAELKELVDNYLQTLYTVFGKEFPITRPMISYMAGYSVDRKYQTQVFNAITHLKKLKEEVE